jgi:hypothetical protein
MLTYAILQDRPREFLAATGLTHDEFARVLPAFAAAYTVLYPPDKTWAGKVRQRQSGGGAKGILSQMEDKLLFILIYQKTNPLQTRHGLQFDLSQPQTHYWIHHLLPVLQHALATLGVAPERDASRVATPPWRLREPPMGSWTALRAVANVPPTPCGKRGSPAARRKRLRTRTSCWSTPTLPKWPIWDRRWPAKHTTRKRPMPPRFALPPTRRWARTRVFRARSRREG